MTAIVGEQALPERRSLPIAFRHIAIVVHLTDAALIVATSIVTGCLYRIVTNNVLGEVDQFATTGLLVAALVLGFNTMHGLGNPEELLRPRKQLHNAVIAWLVALFIVLSMAFSWKVSSDFSRGAFLTFCPVGLLLMMADRLLWFRLLRTSLAQDRLRLRNAVVLIGADQSREAVATQLAVLKRHGFLPLQQVFLPGPAAWPKGDFAARLRDELRGTTVEELVILGDLGTVTEVMDCLRRLPVPVPVRFLPVGAAKALCERRREVIGDSVLVDMERGPMSGAERAAKMTFDKVTAAVVLFLLIPLMALCAVLIRLDSKGPVFYRQLRGGFNGRPFYIWKFRTMRVIEEGNAVRQVVRDDARITRVGRVLRRTSFDEVPQLINVLRGEMSLVGPRPHAMTHDEHYDRLIANYPLRQHVLPGLTGWAQIRGARGETPTIEHMKRRVELDLWYVQNWTFWRDIWILACTGWHVISTRNAY